MEVVGRFALACCTTGVFVSRDGVPEFLLTSVSAGERNSAHVTLLVGPPIVCFATASYAHRMAGAGR